MHFELEQAVAVLGRTPATLRALLYHLPRPWVLQNEGVGTWSPYDVVGHLIECDETGWILRVNCFFNHDGTGDALPPDPSARTDRCRGKSMEGLLSIFAALRAANLDTLEAIGPTPYDLARSGRHEEFGTITLGQLLSSWVVHDLEHIGQITRVMARRYSRETGPWREFLPVLGP